MANIAPTKRTSLSASPWRQDERRIEYPGLYNLRDLGGLLTATGRRVRSGVVFRSDGVHRLAKSDGLTPFRLRTVIDLRTTEEFDHGHYRFPGITTVHLPILRTPWADTASNEPTFDTAAFLAERYLDMLATGGSAVAAVFELLASEQRLPLLFHCSAGKDRTGVVAALILGVLGVSDHHVAQDYHLSVGSMVGFVDRIAAAEPGIAAQMATQPLASLDAPIEAMPLMLNRIRRDHGSVDGYLASIGIHSPLLARVRGALLTDR